MTPKSVASSKTKKALVIVESPSKAKTIQKYLGRDYRVKATVGHIKDLPRSKLGVNIEKKFEPEYQVIKGKDKIIKELQEHAKDVSEIFLAPDPDREGEAIAWHIKEELPKRGKKISRILFNAITKGAIQEAMKWPLELDEKKYRSQQARRILDRLVGYKISPLLWDKVRRGLSAGRVQSVALRMIVEREREIKAFKSDEYWTLDILYAKSDKPFLARLAKIDGQDPVLNNQTDTEQLIDELRDQQWRVSKIETKERQRRPAAPFITSKLQQEAARKLGFSASKTMMLAQRLYEGRDLGDAGTHGLVTYIRTDSVRLTNEAVNEVRAYIEKAYGKALLPPEPVFYKTKKSAQDAHEAIRPTNLEFTPDFVERYLERDEFRLYQLIWNRFVACQMLPAVFDQTTIELETKTKGRLKPSCVVISRVTGSQMKFPGFTLVYEEGRDESETSEESGAQELPAVKEGETYQAKDFQPEQHFTQPPPRFTDASLIKELEEKGIGRPSTYASILSNLQDREYVEKRENKYFPSELGLVVTDLLVQSFPDILNVAFTSEMEDKLDQIEEGQTNLLKMMQDFWGPFQKTLETAKVRMKDIKSLEIPTDHKCEKCGATMVVKWGKLGQFLACSNYPECKYTSEFKKDDAGVIVLIPREKSGKICPKCNSDLLVKHGKFGKFLACEKYPDCKHTETITLGIKCPSCADGEIAQRMSRYKRIFYGCNKYPNCTFAMWDKPVAQSCPQCANPILSEKITKREGTVLKCPNKECDYKKVIEGPAQVSAVA